MLESNHSQSTLRTSIFAAKAAIPAADNSPADYDLPDMSEPYQAHARPAENPVYTLHCLLGKDGIRSFQYVHLDSDSSFKAGSAGQVITLRFVGSQVMKVTITGRKLWRLYDHLHQHRIPWVMRADRDWAVEQEPIIMAIDIVAIDSPSSEAMGR